MAEIIAHRGFSKKAPENTVSAVRMAIEHAVDYIEIDVHLTKDGVPVVIHDSILGRTTPHSTPQRISDLTLDNIKHLDAGALFDARYTGETIPTLDDILSIDWATSGLMIEIKKGHSPIKPLVTAVGKKPLEELYPGIRRKKS